MRKTRFCVAAMLCLAAPALPDAAERSPRTVVTLGFDDGRSTQLDVLPLLAELGLRASFFVNSGRIGARGHLDHAALVQIRDAGHEIGGHTVDHEVLPDLPLEEVVRQVCDDRAALSAAGFGQLVSFAYPRGASNPEVAAVLESCGYRYARGQGGLDDAECTAGCIFAESIEPPDLLRLRSPSSVTRDWTLEDLQGFILRAETTGGWLGLAFHHVCEECSYTYSISPGLLHEFLEWLAARADRGTVVLPMGEAFLPPPPERYEPPGMGDSQGLPEPPPFRPAPLSSWTPPTISVRADSASGGCSSAGTATAATGPGGLLAVWLLTRRRTAAGDKKPGFSNIAR